ncbi:MAG: SusF/SusE family outer membrane protein [Muribaculaceae bacterium]|nr:SusF/SusE family outer membrane protein [Muribaculaceae bacterium]
MKKIALIGALALCLGFTSCDGYEEPNAPAQSNPQDAILEANGLSFTADATTASETVDLAKLNDEGQVIKLATLDLTQPFPADYELKLVAQVAKSNDFSPVQEIPCAINGNSVEISPDDMQGAFLKIHGKAPDAKDVHVRLAAYAVNGTSEGRIGDPDFFYGPFTMHVLPFPSNVVIEEAYYLIGTACDWTMTNAIKFNHGEGSPYDNPVFTLSVDITADQAAAGWWWKIVPESTFVTGDWADGPNSQFGVEENGDNSLEGMLMAKTEDFEPGAGCIVEEGQYLLTINMLDGTYEFTEYVPFLYTPGDSNGWNQTASQLLFTSDGAQYQGFVYLTGGFKFTNAPDWNHINYGDGGEAGVLSNDGGAGNLSVDAAGLYYATANTAALTYALTQVTTFGVIGDATPNGWDASTALTPSEDFLTWTGEIDFSGTGEFKFRANDAWDINLGGDLSDLTQDGANIATPGAGTYVVTLMFNELPYSATVVKK